MAPASEAGAVAPAWPAESSSTGMPPRTATSRQRQASAANFIGGTTKQLDWLTKGRSRHCSSLPADHVQHLQRGLALLRRHPAGADMLGRAHHAGVAGVEVHIGGIGDVAADDGALEEMDMLHLVDDAGDVVDVLHRRFPIGAGDGIDDVHRRPGGAEIDALAPGLQVVLRILAVQRETPRGLGERVLHQRAREEQAALVVQ